MCSLTVQNRCKRGLMSRNSYLIHQSCQIYHQCKQNQHQEIGLQSIGTSYLLCTSNGQYLGYLMLLDQLVHHKQNQHVGLHYLLADKSNQSTNVDYLHISLVWRNMFLMGMETHPVLGLYMKNLSLLIQRICCNWSIASCSEQPIVSLIDGSQIKSRYLVVRYLYPINLKLQISKPENCR